jgi:ribosomal protein L7/L12
MTSKLEQILGEAVQHIKVPSTILRNASKALAEDAKHRLEQIGAQVEVKGVE